MKLTPLNKRKNTLTKTNAKRNSKAKKAINHNAPPSLRYSNADRKVTNCMFHALGIDLNKSRDNFNRRQTFLQVRKFSRMVEHALKQKNSRGSLCNAVWREVMHGGLLRHRRLPIPLRLIRKTKPTRDNLAAAWKRLGIRPTYFKIAVFVAPDKKSGGSGSDFHFARKTASGKWEHKPGGGAVTNLDTDGHKLHPKFSAAAGRLRVGKYGAEYRFCRYLWVASRGTRFELSRRLKLDPFRDALVKALEDQPSYNNNRRH